MTALSMRRAAALLVSRAGHSTVASSRSSLTVLHTKRWSTAGSAPKHQESNDDVLKPPPPSEKVDDRAEPSPAVLEFSSLRKSISYETYKAITERPFQHKQMTSVQSAVLPLLPSLAEAYDHETPADEERPPRDLLVRAKTGTGKTLAFLVPAIESRLKTIEAVGKEAVQRAGLVSDKNLAARSRRLFTRTDAGAVILSPTRELASQIAAEALKLTSHHDNFEVRLFVGGNSRRNQLRDWMRGRRDIVVATPGRLRDLLENEQDIRDGIAKSNMLILDEADTLLDMGFREDIDAIVSHFPKTPQRQTFMFSATVSPQIRQVARAALDPNHMFIDCVTDDAPPTHAHIPQYHTILPSADQQIPHLLRLIAHDQLTNPGKSKVMVFLSTTKQTQLFATLLRKLSKYCLPSGTNANVYEMHSKREQTQRDRISSQFRRDTSGAAILVTSDVSARGVDYPGVTRVIQVGIPSGTDQYIHRVGRTGRGGNTNGRADLVLLPWEMGFVTWQLTHIPLKPVTTNELKSEVLALATECDTDPRAYVAERGSSKHAPAYMNTPFLAVAEKIPEHVTSVLEQLDEDVISETAISMLGFYVGRSGDLRTRSTVIVEGIKDWAVRACGLPKPPYISQDLLNKLGGREKRGEKDRRWSGDSRPQQRWQGRGKVSSRTDRDSYQNPRRDRDDDRESYRESRRDRDGDRDSYSDSRRGRDNYRDRDTRPDRNNFRDRDNDRDTPRRRNFDRS